MNRKITRNETEPNGLIHREDFLPLDQVQIQDLNVSTKKKTKAK